MFIPQTPSHAQILASARDPADFVFKRISSRSVSISSRESSRPFGMEPLSSVPVWALKTGAGLPEGIRKALPLLGWDELVWPEPHRRCPRRIPAANTSRRHRVLVFCCIKASSRRWVSGYSAGMAAVRLQSSAFTAFETGSFSISVNVFCRWLGPRFHARDGFPKTEVKNAILDSSDSN